MRNERDSSNYKHNEWDAIVQYSVWNSASFDPFIHS